MTETGMIISCGLDPSTRVDVSSLSLSLSTLIFSLLLFSSRSLLLMQPYLPFPSYLQGHVGYPMPGVQVRLLSETGEDVTDAFETPGEVQVKGSNIFTGYWNDAATTAKEFVVDEKTGDRWFKVSQQQRVSCFSSPPRLRVQNH